MPFNRKQHGSGRTSATARVTTSIEKWDNKNYGSDDIKRFEVVGQGDLTSQLRFIQFDDGNKDDKIRRADTSTKADST
jgi:hypothetical protein